MKWAIIVIAVTVVCAAVLIGLVLLWTYHMKPSKAGLKKRDRRAMRDNTLPPIEWYPVLEERIDPADDAPVRSEQRSGSAPK
jgi:hypothetical protein